MTHEFRLADIGEGLEQAEIVEWHVSVGDRVRRDQPIVEVLTDKSNAELPAPVDGIVVSLGGAVGDLIEVGALVAVIDDGAVATASAGPGSNRSLPRPAQDPEGPVAPSRATTASRASASARGARRPKASPATRLLARELAVDLNRVAGSGPGGRILQSDVARVAGLPAVPTPTTTRAAPPATTTTTTPPTPITPPATAAPPPARVDDRPPSPEPALRPDPVLTTSAAVADVRPTADLAASSNVEPLRGIRRAIATNMARSWSEIPHIHAFEHIDAEPLLALRAQLRESGRAAFADLTPLTFFAAAVSVALRDHPRANASLDMTAGTIQAHDAVNVGVAIAAPQGLVVPVVRNAPALGFAELEVEIRRLIRSARDGALDPVEYRGGTVTLTNFGSLGGEQALPLIRPPESVIFGFGSIRTRPFVIDDEVVARQTMHVVLGADHRLLDGDVTTSMIRQVCDLLTNPINLVLGD